MTQDFRDAAGLVEILLEPFEDTGDLRLLLVGQKFVKIIARQPGPVGLIVLLIEFISRVSKPLQRWTTARCANQHGVRAIANQRSQRPVFDIIQRNFAAADLVAFAEERVLQLPDTLGRIIRQDPAERKSVVAIHERGSFFIALGGIIWSWRKLLQIFIQRGKICLVLFPCAVVYQSLLIHILLQQPIELVMINPRANIDIFASLTLGARRRADADESEDNEKDPGSHFISVRPRSAGTSATPDEDLLDAFIPVPMSAGKEHARSFGNARGERWRISSDPR